MKTFELSKISWIKTFRESNIFVNQKIRNFLTGGGGISNTSGLPAQEQTANRARNAEVRRESSRQKNNCWSEKQKKSEKTYIAAGATKSEDYANLLQDMAIVFFERGKYDEEMTFYTKSEEAHIAAGATHSVRYANLLAKMAIVFKKQGKYDEAMTLYKKSKETFLAAGATNSVSFASLLRSMRPWPCNKSPMRTTSQQ